MAERGPSERVTTVYDYEIADVMADIGLVHESYCDSCEQREAFNQDFSKVPEHYAADLFTPGAEPTQIGTPAPIDPAARIYHPRTA